MISANQEYIASFTKPVRQMVIHIYLKDKDTNQTVEIFDEDEVKSITYERVGDNTKFFGYGICQKMNIHILDKTRKFDISTQHYFQVLIGVSNTVSYFSPNMYVTQVRRDELTNELSITCYDAIYQMTAHTVDEIDITSGMTLFMYAGEGAAVLNLECNYIGDRKPFQTSYIGRANFDGAETLRQFFDSLAEATQSIYYLNNQNQLIFKQLSRDGEPVYTIDREQQFELDDSTNRRLTGLCHTTELGDAITSRMDLSGTTQYLRDNPFYELREDIHTLLDDAITRMGGLTIHQFDCRWRGNPVLEIGDKIALVQKNGETAISYLLNDVIEYDGSYLQKTEWRYDDDPAETAENSTNLGDMLYKTYARVDKVNQEIEMVVTNVRENQEDIAALQVSNGEILAHVSKQETAVNAAVGNVNNSVAELTKKVEAAITAEDVKLSIQSELQNGVNKVTTSTGFTFNEEGLRVSKSGTEMETVISEDGMTVYKNNQAVLEANNTGVIAKNLHANTYLIIGNYSRLEDYEPARTGCFWIGG